MCPDCDKVDISRDIAMKWSGPKAKLQLSTSSDSGGFHDLGFIRPFGWFHHGKRKSHGSLLKMGWPHGWLMVLPLT